MVSHLVSRYLGIPPYHGITILKHGITFWMDCSPKGAPKCFFIKAVVGIGQRADIVQISSSECKEDFLEQRRASYNQVQS
jgi:hypothetical protein